MIIIVKGLVEFRLIRRIVDIGYWVFEMVEIVNSE